MIALMALSRPHCFWFSKQIRTNNSQLKHCQQTRARIHTHTRVNCAALIVDVSKCSHSVGWVINIPDGMNKSEATIPMRWCFCSWNFLSGCSLPPWAAQNQRYAINRSGHQESLALSNLAPMALSRPQSFVLASRYAGITPDFNIVSKRARAHSYAHSRQLCDVDCRLFKM